MAKEMNEDIVKAREVLHNISGHDYDSCGNYPLERREAEKIINILNKFISRNIETGWIPCKLRLPEENGVYFACYEDATVLLDWFNDKWFIHGKNPAVEAGTVIAWMPLPEPYKVESENKKNEIG